MKIEEMRFALKAIINIFCKNYFKQDDIDVLLPKHDLRIMAEEMQIATDPDAITNVHNDASLIPAKKEEKIRFIQKIQQENSPEVLLKKIKFFYSRIYILLGENLQTATEKKIERRRTANQTQMPITDEEAAAESDSIKSFLAQYNESSNTKLIEPAYIKLYCFAEQIITFFENSSATINFIQAYQILVRLNINSKSLQGKPDEHIAFVTVDTSIVAEGLSQAEALYNHIYSYCFRKKSDPFVDMLQGLNQKVREFRAQHQQEEAKKADDVAKGLSVPGVVSGPLAPLAAAMAAHSPVFSAISSVGSGIDSSEVMNAKLILQLQEMIISIKNSTQNIGPQGLINLLQGRCELIGLLKNNILFEKYLLEGIIKLTPEEKVVFVKAPSEIEVQPVNEKILPITAESSGEVNAYDEIPVLPPTPAELQVVCALMGDLIGRSDVKMQSVGLLEDIRYVVREWSGGSGSVIGRIESKDRKLKSFVDLVMINAYSRYLSRLKDKNKEFPGYKVCKEFLLACFKHLDDWNEKMNIGILVEHIYKDSDSVNWYFRMITPLLNNMGKDLNEELRAMLPLIVFYIAQFPLGHIKISEKSLQQVFLGLKTSHYRVLCDHALSLSAQKQGCSESYVEFTPHPKIKTAPRGFRPEPKQTSETRPHP